MCQNVGQIAAIRELSNEMEGGGGAEGEANVKQTCRGGHKSGGDQIEPLERFIIVNLKYLTQQSRNPWELQLSGQKVEIDLPAICFSVSLYKFR